MELSQAQVQLEPRVELTFGLSSHPRPVDWSVGSHMYTWQLKASCSTSNPLLRHRPRLLLHFMNKNKFHSFVCHGAESESSPLVWRIVDGSDGIESHNGAWRDVEGS